MIRTYGALTRYFENRQKIPNRLEKNTDRYTENRYRRDRSHVSYVCQLQCILLHISDETNDAG